MQPYSESSVIAPVNHSNLFNAMIYPFTRMVIYGSIWYQGKSRYCIDILDLIDVGESNAGKGHYDCYFSKMIEYWREIWHERTNGITDIQYPFGFVQVSLILTD
jgi:sialate O-acetylesterase